MVDQINNTCESCGREIEENTLCECGYDPSLNEKEIIYHPQFAITTLLKRTQDGKTFTSSEGAIWELNEEDVLSFIQKVEKKFRGKRKNHDFVSSEQQILPNSTPTVIKKYIQEQLQFTELVKAIMKNFQEKAILNKGCVSGGSIVFIHYNIHSDEDSKGRLFILMVDDYKVFNFDERLIPQQLQSIDIDSLRQAALIDLTLFDEIYPKNQGEPYLQFITGKSASNFFKRALGCNEDLDNNQSIKELDKAISGFLTKIKASRPERHQVNDAITELMYNKLKSPDKKLSIDDIQDVVEKALKGKKNIKGKFVKFVLQNDYKINEYFEPSRSSIDFISKIKISDTAKSYDCSIAFEALSEDKNSDSKVIYDKENGTITIKLTEDNIKEINYKFLGVN